MSRKKTEDVAAGRPATAEGCAAPVVAKPEGVPTPPPARSRLAAVEDEISELEDRRKELLFEVAKEEAREDEDFLEEVHKDCVSREEHKEVEDERDDAQEKAGGLEEAVERLRQFGGHSDCLEGAVVGRRLHPQCTCGWNEVATELERLP